MNGVSDPVTGFAKEVQAMLLARAQRGDMQAFAELYRYFGRACFQLALRILGQRQQAEDMVHEVFLKMIDTIGSYRGEAPFGAWLKRLTVNACIDQLRRQRHSAEEDAEAAFANAASADADAAGIVDTESLLARLPVRARAIVVLHELEGYTHAELAAAFKQSESYSKSVLARALKRLNALVTAPSMSSSQVVPWPKRN
jgi:RNA polymerase sigma-70 factor, ECF subfamily